MPPPEILVSCFLLVVTFYAARFFYSRWVEDTFWRILCIVLSIIDTIVYVLLLIYIFRFWLAQRG